MGPFCVTCCSTFHQAGLGLCQPMKVFVIFLTLILGLDGLQCGLDHKKSLEDKIVLTPLIILAQIQARFQTWSQVEINIRVLNVFKKSVHLPNLIFLRLKFEANCHDLKLGQSYVFYLSENFKPLQSPDLNSRKVKRKIRKLSCKNCGKFNIFNLFLFEF